MRIRNTTLVALAAAFLLSHASQVCADASRRERTKSRPITRPKFDPSAERVPLFSGMKEGTLESKVIAMGPKHGSVLVTNTTEEPLTVEFPKSFVVVHVLKQFGGGGGGLGGQQGGGFGGGQQGGGQQGGQQAGGGGLGGQQGGGGGGFGGGQQGGGGGGGFFSIPPEKTIKLSYVSTCLNHGKPDPTPRANYAIIPVEEYTNDPVLKELILMVGTGRMAPQAAQAAVWNRTDNMSWQELANKFSYGVVGNKVPYFTGNDLRGAQMISTTAVARVRERGDNPEPEATPVRGRVR
ncbi:MAG: hypothetical protein GY903_21755 [Fuerstiella sp.]|nr:hypothetical protein [Fuerstiella sp.]MCP4857117.1 hypothetical protein [Fuerstiella sp.]